MGRTHAKLLARLGARVVVNDLDPGPDEPWLGGDESAAGVVAEIVDAGGTAVASYADISTSRGAEKLIRAAVRAYGRIDAVVNNAGIVDFAPVNEITARRLDKMFKVNAYGPFYVTRAAWPHFVGAGYGRVVMIASIAGLVGIPDRAHYAASKGALIGMTKALAADGEQHHIRVNAVAPGAITRMTTEPARARMVTELNDVAADSTEAVRATDIESLMAMTAELVSPVVAWLAHERCAVSGEIMEARAGRVSRLFVGATQGYRSLDLSIDQVERHVAEIMAQEQYSVRESFISRTAWSG
jgi:NAD(P)-dependent dehydrogenase (short-subunit alcohol dehydrogenase family)